MSKKYVYLFSEGNGSMRELLGGKGANLAEMTNLGMPVPQGFTVTPKPAPSIMKTAARSMQKSKQRSMNILPNLKRSPEKPLVIKTTLFLFPFVPAQELPCPV